MPALRKLQRAGWYSHQSSHNLFGANAFLNLTDLCFRNATFGTPLRLANCPSLRILTIIHCEVFSDGVATLSIPHPLQSKSSYYAASMDVDQYTLPALIISQIQDLESLVLELISPESEDENFLEEELIDPFRTELVFALEMQQGILTELIVCEEHTAAKISLAFGGEELFQAIQGCEKRSYID